MTAPQRPTPRTDALIAGIEGELGDGPPLISEAAIDIAVRCRLIDFARSLERSLSEREEECEMLRGLLREAAKLLWSHNGAGQEKAWALSEKIDAFSAAEAGGARDRTTK